MGANYTRYPTYTCRCLTEVSGPARPLWIIANHWYSCCHRFKLGILPLLPDPFLRLRQVLFACFPQVSPSAVVVWLQTLVQLRRAILSKKISETLTRHHVEEFASR